MSRRGFTILELTLVIAVMIVLAALGWPQIEVMYSGARLTAGADHVRGQWAEARARAIEDQRSYRFAVIPGTGQYRIAPLDDGTAGGTDQAGDPNAQPPLTIEDTLPTGVQFSERRGSQGGAGQDHPSDDSGDGYTTLVVFRADGTADRDVEIVFETEGGRPLQLRLRGLTGAVTSQWLDAEK